MTDHIYPDAVYRPVVGIANDPAIIPIGVILHVTASYGSPYNYFNGLSDGVESHLYVPRSSDHNTEQYRLLNHEADANYKGNSWIGSDGRRYGFLSVETEGLADGKWTDHQLAEIKAFLLWASRKYGFPLRVCPSYRSAGIGWHVMWQPTGVGTDSWSNSVGKVCPGANRVAQFKTVIVPWMKALTSPAPPPTEEEILMTAVEQILDAINDVHNQVAVHNITNDVLPDGSKRVLKVWTALEGTYDGVVALQTDVKALRANVTALQAAVVAIANAEGADSAAIVAAVDAAVREALRTGTVHVDVAVSGGQAAT